MIKIIKFYLRDSPALKMTVLSYKLANNKSHLDFINVSAGGGDMYYLSYIENYCN